MLRPVIETWGVDCPWQSWERPNLRWCEELQCGWIVTPFNAWTNVAYAVVAYIMWHHNKRVFGGRVPLIQQLFVWGCLSTAIGSFLYHATYTFVFQVADFVGMFLFLAAPLVSLADHYRLFRTNAGASALYTGIVTSLTVAMFVMHANGWPYQSLVLGMIVGVLLGEFVLVEGIPSHQTHRNFYIALALIIVAATCSAIDQLDIYCDPKAEFWQGHGLWHLLAATSMLHIYYHFVAIDAHDHPDHFPARKRHGYKLA